MSTNPKKILMVCLGNICRSPMAEALLKTKIDTSVHYVDSAGLDTWHIGEEPCNQTKNICKKNNIPINHKARLFTVKDFDRFDKIYVMDQYNYDMVMEKARSDKDRKKVSLILNELFPGENLDVPDPYKQNEERAGDVFKLLDKATDVIAEKINHGKEL